MTLKDISKDGPVFFKGDKVQCVCPTDSLVLGEIYDVIEQGTPQNVTVMLNGKRSGWFPRRFELVSSAKTPETKDTNPKDAVGTRKAPMSTVSGPVMQEVGVAMLEGARKYGRHNYRVSGVRYSVYHDAALRHLFASFEGQDIDPDSGLSHVTKAIASLFVLRDAMIQGKLVDDRPPATVNLAGFQENLQSAVDKIFDRYPTAKEAFTNDKR